MAEAGRHGQQVGFWNNHGGKRDQGGRGKREKKAAADTKINSLAN